MNNQPRLALIVAMTPQNVIGRENKLPWHMPADLKYFKTLTMNKPIIMGRKTFESIGKPLPGRKNIVITRDITLHYEGCFMAHSLSEAILLAGDCEEIMVIGGSGIFTDALPKADRLYLTIIEADIEGDTYFPALNRDEWIEKSQINHQPDAVNPYPYSFLIWDRIS